MSDNTPDQQAKDAADRAAKAKAEQDKMSNNAQKKA